MEKVVSQPARLSGALSLGVRLMAVLAGDKLLQIDRGVAATP